ncbi:hypothetical protein [Inquilinus sp.]|jgi:hypothetical protein|uniref:hypothetical protein n=1 Tax=Inquilinus sp. TaxID=1932117 RepID=UPI0037841EC9
MATQAGRLTIAALEAVATEQLIQTSREGGDLLIHLPLLYGGGSHVVVNVSPMGSECLVSDMGLAHQEAEMSGSSAFFVRAARTVAERTGVSFDLYSMFVGRASLEQLPSVIAAVASASKEAADQALTKAIEKKYRERSDRLIDRLQRLFPATAIHPDAEIKGASSHSWEVTALVDVDDHQSAFQAVSLHPNSIYAASTMFHDLALLPFAPKRIAVVSNRDQLGSYEAILSQAASVVETEASDFALRRLAA